MSLRALMVDLDGTLASTARANQLAYTSALAEVGVTISQEDFNDRVQGRHWREFLPGILAEAGSLAKPEAIAKRKGEIYGELASAIEVNVALVELLVTSRPQLKTALVTSAARGSVTNLLRAHNLESLFDTVVTGDDVEHHKPHPEAYLTAAARLDVRPEECLIFEDSDVGIGSAKAFGGHVLRIVF